jgi:O-antigen/teichoic acid export membrane protein
VNGTGRTTTAILPIGHLIARNFLSNSVGKIVTLGANLLLAPFVVWQIGAANYGLLTLVGSVLMYGSLLDFGMINTVIRHVAECRARKDDEGASAVVSTALLLYSVAAVIALVLSVAFAPLVPRLFNIAEADRLTAVQLVIISGIGLSLSLPCAITTAVLRGLQRYDLVSLVQIIVSAVYVLVTIAVLVLGGGVLALATAGAVAILFGQVPSLWLIRRIAPGLRITYRLATRAMARKLLSFSSWLFVNDIAGLLQMKTDVIVIGALLPVAAVTPFALCQKLSRVPQVLTEQFVKVLLPIASEFEAHDDQRRLRLLYLWSSRLSLAIFVPIGSAVALLSRDVLALWLGPSYAEYWPLVVILVIALGIDMSQWPAGSILQASARVRLLALVAIATGVANLGLSIVLAQWLGLNGVALGTLVPTTIASLGVVLPYAMRTLGVGVGTVAKEIVLPAVLPAIPAILVLYLLRWSFAPMGFWPLAASGLAGVVVYAVFYVSVGASRQEQETYRAVAVNTIRFVESYVRRQVVPAKSE